MMFVIMGGATFVRFLVLLLLLLLGYTRVFAATNIGGELELKSGVNRLYIEQMDGRSREVLIEIPQQANTKGYPVVFGFHGAGGTAQVYHRRLSRFVRRDGIISVSPLGAKSKDGKTLWNFKQRSHSNADDVGLVYAILALLNQEKRVDSNQIFATGASSGGLMAYRLARETPFFSAIAPTKCGMAKRAHEPLKSTLPVSLLQVIGDRDKSYYGSKTKFVTMYSAKKRIKIWAKHNQCSAGATEDKADSTHTRYVCTAGKSVELMVLKGVGHNLGKSWTQKTDAMIIDFFLYRR